MATIHIHSGKNNLDFHNKNTNVQSVPFRIHADCDANIKTYFNKFIKEAENGAKTVTFRGRPLTGKTIKLPEGYTGVHLYESLKPSTDKCERQFHIINQFSQIHHWNWDKVPSDNDPIIQALQWIDIAEALHSPILEE